MDSKRQDKGLDLEEFLNPKSSLSSVRTFLHVLWLRKWLLVGIWLLLALPAAVFLAFFDIPKGYEATTYLRFPKVESAQNTMARDVSLGESESVVRLFRSQKVLLKTIGELGLQFQLTTKNVFRAHVIDTLSYGENTSPGRYRFAFEGARKVKVTHRPWGARSWRTVHEGPVSADGYLAFEGARIRFKPVLLSEPRDFRLEMIFRSPDEALVDFTKRLKVEPLDKGQVAVNYSVTLEERDPFLVADIVNALSRNFLTVYLGTTRNQDQGVLERMEQSLEASKADLKAVQERLAAFYAKNQGRMAVKEGNPYALASAQTQKAQLETNIDRLTQSLESRPAETASDEDKRLWISEALALLSGQGVQRAEALRGRMTELEKKRMELIAGRSPTHPYVLAADGEMSAFYGPVVALAENARRNFRSRLGLAGAEIARNLPGGGANMGLEIEAKQLTDERDNLARMVDNLQNEFDRAKLTAGPDLFSASVIDPARPPLYEAPTLRSRLMFSAVAIFLAFFPGLLWILLSQVLWARIWNKDDVERKLKLKVLGSLFHIGGKPGDKPAVLSPENHPVDEYLLHFGRFPTHADEEAYRSLRVELENHLDAKLRDGFALLVTSTQPHEGKSLVAANLAIGFARRGKRTLLVDTDFRHGRQARMFGYEPKKGLTDLLKSGGEPGIIQSRAESYLLPTPEPNLFLLPKGTFDEASVEAAYKAPMEIFMSAAQASFDIVILDTAPVIVTADPLGLAGLCGAVIYVMRSGMVSAREASRALDPFRDRDIPLVAVVNGIRQSPADENYYHKYGYYYNMSPEDMLRPKPADAANAANGQPRAKEAKVPG